MLREYCFWLTTIRGQGGREYYCEAPYKDNTNFNCEYCKQYVTTTEMQEFTKEVLKAAGRCLDLDIMAVEE